MHDAIARGGTVSVRLWSDNMSLPGLLQHEKPAVPLSTPTIYDIKENSEWRFEVPFGSKIEVKVGGNSTGTIHKTSADPLSCTALAFVRDCRAVWDRTRSTANIYLQWHESSNFQLARMSHRGRWRMPGRVPG